MITGSEIAEATKKAFRPTAETPFWNTYERLGLEGQTHFKDRPVAETGKSDDHVSPKQQDIGSLGKLQVAEKYEKGGLQEK